MREETAIGGSGREFPSTRWSLIRCAQEQPEARQQALADLLSTYWKPLYFYVRRKGASVEEAKDSVQGLYLHLLEHDFIRHPDQSRGRFRSYLLVAMDHFQANEHLRQSALKRGGGVRTLSLDRDLAEKQLQELPSSPDGAFEKEWAVGVLERGLERLEGEFRNGTRSGPFDAITHYFRPTAAPSYEATAREYGLTVSQLKSLVHRSRKRFREIVREEVSQTLDDDEDADQEIASLIQAMRPEAR